MAGFGVGIACMTLVLCMVLPPSLAAVYTVGDSSGWTLGVNYDTWASDKTFKVGDTLVFNYGSGSHTVEEVSGTDYSSCTTGNSLASDSTGKTSVDLKTAGTHYFTCGVMGHCGTGMKLAVTVAAAGTTTTTPATVGSTTPTTTTPATGNAPLGTTTTTTPSLYTPDPYSSAAIKAPFAALVFMFATLLSIAV
ncbi:hypothetical protein ACFE04_026013 [Oxalis oulophora]